MDVTKIIKATAVRGRTSTAAPIIKEDYGLYLLIGGIDLPEVYEVDFSNDEHAGTSVTMIGNADGVLIPNQFIKSGKDVFAFYYHAGEDFGRTLYTIHIPNKRRPDRTDEEPTPEEQSTIDQAISALNTAVAKTAQDVISADQSARSASGDADRAERARTGAETAQGKAEEAQESAERAKDDAETSERNASESERNAKGYAETASEKADSITGLTATATTLPDGSSATASYNAETGVMSFGIPKGKDGTDGDDGYSPTANVSKTGKVATITITDKNGTTSAQVEDGTDGIDGISPSVSVTDITGGHRVVITDKDGAKSFDVEDGATGATPNLTIGTVETLEPTESATATITGTPENPVLNFGIPKGEQGEVTLEDYYKAFPTDTASGAIASFSDGADDLPLKSLVVDINPVQDLHGQDSPYPAGGGKNLLPYPFYSTDGTYQGVSWTSNNGKLTATGTTSAGTNFYLTDDLNLKAGTYTLSITGTHDGLNLVAWNKTANAVLTSIAPSGLNGRFTLESDAIIRIYFNTGRSGVSVSISATFQLESGTTPTAWSPYENLCPISGWTQIEVEQSGKNLYNPVTTLLNTWINPGTGKIVNGVNGFWTSDFIPVKPSVAYTKPNTGSSRGAWYDANKNWISATNWTLGTKTAPTNARYVRFCGQTSTIAYNGQVQFEEGSTATPYEPYTGRSITIQLGQTVYGGKLDVLSGVLVIDRAIVDLGTLTWNYVASSACNFRASELIGAKPPATAVVKPNAICSILPVLDYTTVSTPVDGITIIFATSAQAGKVWAHSGTYTDATAFKSAVTGQTLVYELAEPIEIQLSANQINSLYGVNNIWADSGDCTAEYRADTKLFIERLTAPDSADMVADANITSGQYFMVGNSLYKATANIANGAQITVGTNCTRVSLAQALNEINA